jgi:uncharacterized membrane protein HdeD (DUF308 family)
MHTEVQLLSWIIMIIGAMFAIPGIIGIVAGVIHSKKQQSTDGIAITTSIGSLLIGIVMMIWPTPFVAIFVYVLAAILIICGVIQIWVLASQYRPYRLPMWLYILPVLVVIAGVVMITSSVKEILEVFTHRSTACLSISLPTTLRRKPTAQLPRLLQATIQIFNNNVGNLLHRYL